jgi:dephospho-CoA kinase
MILVGLTGGVATGKSTVARMFKQCGAVVIDADVLAREVVKPDTPAWRAIVKTFGRSVLNPDRTINRHTLGHIVFRDRAKLRELERIIHPRVAREQIRLSRATARENPHAVIVYDVPLLFEAGIETRVDKIVVVTADRATQIARLVKRNGLSRSDALRRIKSQLPLARKIPHADHVLDGTLSRAALRKLVGQTFMALRAAS